MEGRALTVPIKFYIVVFSVTACKIYYLITKPSKITLNKSSSFIFYIDKP